MTVVPFRDVLRLGSKGTQPVAVKRGLYRAGFHEGWDGLGDEAIAAESLGAVAVQNLRTFQTYHGLKADGVYGEASHNILRGSFDDYATRLYLAPANPTLQLPATFTPTHQTEGLDGYPAIDVFAPARATVGAPTAGKVTRLSGHDPADGGVPGGAYGWSIYLTCPHSVYYLTHLGSRTVTLGQDVKRGDIIGTVCDSAVAHMASNLSHVHEGKHEL